MSKIAFVIGAGVGYVLGTRAGREQYEKLVAQARDVLADPTVREVTDTARAGARRLVNQGRTLVRDTTNKVSGQLVGSSPGE